MEPQLLEGQTQRVSAPTSTGQGPAAGQVRGLAGQARDIIERSPGLVAYNFAYLAVVWGVALGSIALFWAVPAWYTFALAFLAVSSRQQALLNVEHECIHGKFVSSRRWNT